MSELKVIDSASQPAAIRISIPFRVAMDGKLMKQSLSKLAEAIGHEKCFSGVNCLFQLEKDYIINENLSVKNIKETDPEGSPAFRRVNADARLVTATLSEKDTMSIDTIHKISDKIISMRGACPQCHSGFDFQFQHEIAQVVKY